MVPVQQLHVRHPSGAERAVLRQQRHATLFSIELTTGRARVITKFSLFPSEAEVLLPPNSRFKVMGQLDTGNGLVIVQLKELPSRDPIINFDAPAAAAPPPPAPYITGGSAMMPPPSLAVADLPVKGEDPKNLVLSKALEALDVGTAASCLKFAKALEEQGVLSLDRLKKLSVDKAQKVLEKVKMSEIQIDVIMEAIAPTPTSPKSNPVVPPERSVEGIWTKNDGGD